MALACAVAAVALTACGGDSESSGGSSGSKADVGTSSAPKDVKVVLDFLPGSVHMGIYAAVGQGIYKDAGLNVEVEPGRGSSTSASLVASGQVPFGITDASAAAQAVAAGGKVTMVAAILQKEAAGLGFLCSSNIKSVADLKGKSVAGSASTSNWNYLEALLAQNNLKLGSDVQKVFVSAGAQTSAVVNGVAAARTMTIYDLALQSASKEPVCTINYADTGVVTLGHGLIANNDFLKKEPETVHKFVVATMKGYEAAIADPTAAAEAMKKLNPDVNVESSVEGWKAMAPLLTPPEGKPLGYMAPEAWTQSLTFFEQSKLLTGEVGDPARYYTNDFLARN
jgi:NitT/TauT family transport system substrate-binding protein